MVIKIYFKRIFFFNYFFLKEILKSEVYAIGKTVLNLTCFDNDFSRRNDAI